MEQQGIPLEEFVFVSYLMDQNQPYSCEQWGNQGIQGSPPIIDAGSLGTGLYEGLYGGSSVPHMFIIDREGRIVDSGGGNWSHSDTTWNMIEDLVTGTYECQDCEYLPFDDNSFVWDEYNLCYGEGMYLQMVPEAGGDIVVGCTDECCSNYNPEATIDNGSCEDCDPDCYPMSIGCTDPAACNYCETCLVDDGSCIYIYGYGCFNNNCTIEGYCEEYDNQLLSYQLSYCTGYSSFCPPINAGCIDSNACNFNPNATIDDGSCKYSGVDYALNTCYCLGDADFDLLFDEHRIIGYPNMLGFYY